VHRPTGLPIPSSKLPERLLVIGASARLLAESAARAHIRVVALDHYADADTRSLAEQVHAIPTRHGCFRPEPLLEHAARLAPALHYPLVYGSGLDSRPELLERLAADRVVFGNPPSVLALFREPRHFFELLDRCAIPYPDIRYRRPENPENWLIKSGCSEGGKRVRFCAHNRPGPGDYYQRRISGRAFSVLFLADGENVRFMGFNTLWTSKTPGRFLFEGAMNWAPLSLEQRRRIEGNAVKLVKATGLKGLNSLDFMVDVRGGPLTIEVNTRPSATMALYDEDYPEGLLAAHIRACQGLLAEPVRNETFRAFRVAYASVATRMGTDFVWPEWCADRPVAGSDVEAGMPFCTLRAEGGSPDEVMRRLESRVLFLRRLVGPPMAKAGH